MFPCYIFIKIDALIIDIITCFRTTQIEKFGNARLPSLLSLTLMSSLIILKLILCPEFNKMKCMHCK